MVTVASPLVVLTGSVPRATAAAEIGVMSLITPPCRTSSAVWLPANRLRVPFNSAELSNARTIPANGVLVFLIQPPICSARPA